jgi:hypothetical protein
MTTTRVVLEPMFEQLVLEAVQFLLDVGVVDAV